MLPASLNRLLAAVPDDALVLDVGGWAKPLARSDWVIDAMPYATRGMLGRDGEGPERFDSERWVERDVCDREPWPFDDDQFDFVVCSHTLEDLRDPVWACSEIVRVGRAGYIEVPSRLEEQSYGFQGPWVGWGHHHWLCDVSEDAIEFVFKHHVLHGRESDHFPAAFHQGLTPEERVETLWWHGSFGFGERLIVDPEELDSYLADFVTARRAERGSRGWRGLPGRRQPSNGRRR